LHDLFELELGFISYLFVSLEMRSISLSDSIFYL
jgi:hypothetical protein